MKRSKKHSRVSQSEAFVDNFLLNDLTPPAAAVALFSVVLALVLATADGAAWLILGLLGGLPLLALMVWAVRRSDWRPGRTRVDDRWAGDLLDATHRRMQALEVGRERTGLEEVGTLTSASEELYHAMVESVASRHVIDRALLESQLSTVESALGEAKGLEEEWAAATPAPPSPGSSASIAAQELLRERVLEVALQREVIKTLRDGEAALPVRREGARTDGTGPAAG